MYRTSRLTPDRPIAKASSKQNYALILLGLIYIAGVLCGAMIAGLVNFEFVDTVIAILKGFTAQRTSQPVMMTLQSALFPNLMLLFLVVLFGFCAIGAPFITLLPWLQGLAFGLSACLVLINYSYRAFGYVVLLLFPSAVISALVTIFCCRDGLALSLSIYDTVFAKKHSNIQTKLSIFTSRLMIYAVFMLLSALLETALYYTFGGLFSF